MKGNMVSKKLIGKMLELCMGIKTVGRIAMGHKSP
jgi:hypothetical protein